ncbi:amidophosphoribosyltransferase [Sphaeroforma arctica JP610]|uniref:Amidophosphoribosyltransferase n=1 Tax=Sphaeroforma arctica JP610 TaxID=667725 RepID=A0A0L0FUG8_9EUKA|nr:amidophosphoribosyltransferase [Sphaeroforma arctica JP610]KNC80309.1 amidophosphoribosyltransferase [Sphaeroforma arctica JP610]|eukprot:XP_014154211.1 amidophosphoribosyltransferase [Sphaeroforma arctica JP610]
MCGIVGVLLGHHDNHANCELYEGLNLLQHRGQDAAGIVTSEHGHLFQRKEKGLVRDVFTKDALRGLRGHMGLAHVRYPTAGSSSNAETQPFYVNSPYGITLAHNGNLTNSEELKKFLDVEAHRHINTTSDSEVLLNVLAYELQLVDKHRLDHLDIFSAVTNVMDRCRGGYAVIAMVPGYGLIAFRDPHGVRPLVIGKRENKDGTLDYISASESVVLDCLGYELVGDVLPGECVILRTKRHPSKEKQKTISHADTIVRAMCLSEGSSTSFTPCIFEYVYFARPDSLIDGVSVYKARLAMGEALGRKIQQMPKLLADIDVIIPVPDTSRVAALQMSVLLNKTYREGFIKNRYVGRTFIMPGQAERVASVRRKLNAMPLEFKDKNVMLVDDSIVRGTTCKEIINMAREAGAAKVYVASCAPEIRYPNVYGIDMPTRQELVAYNRTLNDISRYLGADEVVFQNLEDLVNSVLQCSSDTSPVFSGFDTSVFNGKYITGDIDEAYIEGLENFRNESSKFARTPSEPEIDGLYNSLR